MPSRNGVDFLKRNMPSLVATDYPNWTAVLADNASTDESVRIVRENFPFFGVIAAGTDRGFAGNVNRGLRWALAREADYIAVISNDVRVPPCWLRCAIEKMQVNPSVGILGFKEINYPDELAIPEEVTIENTVYPTGCAFVLRSEAVRRAGFYDEVLYMYGEEQDYYPRIIQAGFTLAKINVPVLHERHGFGRVSARSVWLRYRNGIYCALKNFGIATGSIVAAKMFCYAVLPGSWLGRLRSRPLAGLANQATLSAAAEGAVDTTGPLRSGNAFKRSGIFLAALGWNILHLPRSLRANRRLSGSTRKANRTASHAPAG